MSFYTFEFSFRFSQLLIDAAKEEENLSKREVLEFSEYINIAGKGYCV